MHGTLHALTSKGETVAVMLPVHQVCSKHMRDRGAHFFAKE